MKLAIMQPYLFPYIGYFQLINSTDIFVIYDDVNYIKKGWINRNNILENGKNELFTIPIHKASQNKLINQLEINNELNNLEKFKSRIKQNYSRAPYFKDVYSLIEKILEYKDLNLAKFISNSLEKICIYLGINTRFIVSSEIEKDNSLKGQEKIIHISKILDADIYINPIGGMELYNNEEFKFHDIDLKFLKPKSFCYKQFESDFVPWLSIIDVMMFNSRDEISKLLQEFELV